MADHRQQPEPTPEGGQADEGLPDPSELVVGFEPPQKPSRIASIPISLGDDRHVITDEDRQRLQEDMHTPWEGGGEQGRILKRKWVALAFGVVGLAALVVFFVTRREGDAGEGVEIRDESTLAYIPQAELRESIAASVRVLASSRDPDEVLGVIRDPQGMGAQVRAYLSNNPTAREVSGVELAPNSSLFSSEQSVLLKAVVEFADFNTRNAVIEWRKGEALVDWEHWVHYQPIPVDDFLAGKGLPEGAAPEFRLSARWAAAFVPSEKFDETRYRCVQLRDPRVHGDEFPAYVARGSAAEVKLEQLLPGKTERAVMLELALVEGAVQVTGWVASGWCRKLW